MKSVIFLTVFFITNSAFVEGQHNDDLYILIDEVSVFNCRGVKNEIKITEEDIDINNEKGEKVFYIRAPGNYTVNFKKINVKEDFGFLAGEIGVTLQVPIIEGPAGIRFDLPYTMIPETTLLSQKCDDNSGIVERDGRQYCRYCDLCGVSEGIENDLNRKGHKFLPEVVQGEEKPFAPACSSIKKNSYQFKRTISLPSRSTLEQLIKDKVQGIDGEIKKRLNKGRGRFQVFLNLISSEKASITQSRWFSNSKECFCCVHPNEPACNSFSYLYCNMEDCKSAWAQMCLHNTARIAACHTVEFNYRMTTSTAEVQLFLEEKHYDTYEFLSHTRPKSVPVAPALLQAHQLRSSLQKFRVPIRSLPVGGHTRDVFSQPIASVVPPPMPKLTGAALTEECVLRMPPRLTHLRRYCTIFWNSKLCCAHCAGLC